MRIEIKEIKIYKFEELTEESKEKARRIFRTANHVNGYAWDNENNDSLKAFLDLFNCSLKRGGYVRCNDSDTGEMEGLRLYKYIMNNFYDDIYKPKSYWINDGIRNCVGMNSKTRYSKIFKVWDNCSLTGYCMDNDLLQPVIDFLKKPSGTCFNDLLTSCYESWEYTVKKEQEYQDSNKAIDENISINEYEFYEDGSLY